MNRFAKNPTQACRGRQVPTDRVSYVEVALLVAEKPSMNRSTKRPRQRCRSLSTRQVPTDRVSYVEETIRVSRKSSMNRFTTSPIQVCRDLPAWDAFNRLSMADDLKVKPSGTVLRYAYDTGNRRVAKVTLDVSASSTINDLYLYGGWQVLEERRTPSLQTNPSSTLHRQFVYGNYIDEPLVMDTNEDNDGDCLGTQDSRLFHHTNTLFLVYALTDEDGNIVEAYAYDPYGKHAVIKDGDSDGKVEFDASDSRVGMGVSNFDNPYTFTGRRYDHETGLYYFRYRYYDQLLQRFISRDPLRYLDGNNLYNAYFVPMRIDPFGLSSADLEDADWDEIQTLEELESLTGLGEKSIVALLNGQIAAPCRPLYADEIIQTYICIKYGEDYKE